MPRPCALSVQKSEIVNIKYFVSESDMSVMNMIYQSNNKQGTLDIDSKVIALEDVHFKGIFGYVYKGVTVEKLLFKNVSYECPEYYIYKTEMTSTNPDSVQLSPHHLENGTTILSSLTMHAMSRALLPFFTSISDAYSRLAGLLKFGL